MRSWSVCYRRQLTITITITITRPSSLEAVAPGRLQFRLGAVDVADAGPDGGAAVRVAGWPTLGVAGEPDLPVLRRAMLLPRGAGGAWRAVVRDAETEVLPLAEANAAIAKCKDGSARYRMVLEM